LTRLNLWSLVLSGLLRFASSLIEVRIVRTAINMGGGTMRRFFNSKNKLLALATTVGAGAFLSASALAYTVNSSASVTFRAPLTVTENNAIGFSDIATNIPDASTVIISTDNTVSGTGASYVLGTPGAGDATVSGATGLPISIHLKNSVANGGVALSGFTCKFHTDAEAACDTALLPSVNASPTGVPLVYGATATFTGPFVDGTTAAPTFDIEVTYQ